MPSAPIPGIVFLANPGNPTGTRIPASEIRRLRDALREDILLVIDEAYGEFADQADAALRSRGAGRHGRPAHLLQGLWPRGGAGRLGAVSHPPSPAELRKVMNPNSLPPLSQAAAEAALSDLPYMRATCALIATTRARAADPPCRAGIATPTASPTSFFST
jgi:histidinol-phosphate aminotransferase